MNTTHNLLEHTNKGLYCRIGDFYIDPSRAVDRALITHAHSDHARPGMKYYLAQHDTVTIMKVRLGVKNLYEGIAYGEVREINGVKLSFHPAGHIIGSAQIRLEYKGEVWVVSGDYKLEDDGICTPFEPVRCHNFITETTFGLPIYKWQPQAEVFGEINAWWRGNKEKGYASVLYGYSLGKAQRILYNLDASIGDVYLHSSVYYLNQALIAEGHPIPYFPKVESAKKDNYPGALVIVPPSWGNSSWMKRFLPYSTANASGWMLLRNPKQYKGIDKSFVLSDHADWNELNHAVDATGAERVFVTHGYTAAFAAWLNSRGIEAHSVNVL